MFCSVKSFNDDLSKLTSLRIFTNVFPSTYSNILSPEKRNPSISLLAFFFNYSSILID